MLTPSDLRNPRSKSGYKCVLVDDGHRLNGHGGTATAYQSDLRRIPGYTDRRYGPRRATALESAQDYCDAANSVGMKLPKRKKSAGHAQGLRDSLPKDPEVQAALGVLRDARGQRQGRQGYVYLIIEVHPGGGLVFGKVGYSTNPRARVAELQTGNPRPLRLLYAKPGTLDDEAALHEKYADLNVLQEWFDLNHANAVPLLLEWDAEHYVEED